MDTMKDNIRWQQRVPMRFPWFCAWDSNNEFADASFWSEGDKDYMKFLDLNIGALSQMKIINVILEIEILRTFIENK